MLLTSPDSGTDILALSLIHNQRRRVLILLLYHRVQMSALLAARVHLLRATNLEIPVGQPKVTLLLLKQDLLRIIVDVIQIIVESLHCFELLDCRPQTYQVSFVLCHCVNRVNCVFLSGVTFKLLFD